MASKSETSKQDVTPIHVHCHCKAHSLTFNIPNNHLPLAGNHCYCNMCRQTNGAFFESYISIPQSMPVYTQSSPAPSTLKYYSCTPAVKRYFCAKCGTHLFFHENPDNTLDGEWYINAGALTTANNDLVEYKHHIFVEEGARNDGLGIFNLVDDGLPRYAKFGTNQQPLTAEELTTLLELTKSSLSTATVDSCKRLPLSCYCGRVKALLSRPSAHPNNKWLESFATPDKTRWLGEHCGCESCRLSSGSVVFSFVFPSAQHLEWLDSPEPGCGPEEDGVVGENDWRAKAGMTWWRSSDPVVRGFCGTCGAVVLYQSTNKPGIEEFVDQKWSTWGLSKDAFFDVPIGLLRTSSQEGERLADWVDFKEEVCYAEDLDTYDKTLKTSLLKGTKN